MTTSPTPDQAAVQQQLGPVLQAAQPLWDNPNPTPEQKGAVRLMAIAFSLADPSQAHKLEAVFNTLAVLEHGGAEKATALTVFLREMLAGSSEYELCEYILGDGTDMPSWPNVAAMLTQIAMRDAQQSAAQPVTTPAAPTPPPTQPAPGPSPAQVFANLNSGAPWQAAPTAAPTPPQTPPQPTPQPAAAPTSTPQPTPPQTHQPTPQPPNSGPGAVKQRRRGGVTQ